MVFHLTDELIDTISDALENQEKHFVVDAEKEELIESSLVNVDDDRFYVLPEWNSANGFELRQKFVSNLHSPIAQKNLHDSLHSGRGAFKNFKNELKKYPQVEKLWCRFRQEQMHNFIFCWYNELREVWGLEKLEAESDFEDTEHLVEDDFTFEHYNTDLGQEIALTFSSAQGDFDNNWPQEICGTIIELWQKQFLQSNTVLQTGFICRSLSNEFAGCITVTPVSKRTESVVFLSSFFVPEKFRGLGIGTKLLEKCLESLRALKKQWIFIAGVNTSKSMERLLIRFGFEKTGSGYSAKIQ
ncbi:MAG: GNAT family N-acetyltransferase [Treponema sp.]|nr:GNAT family N-acetyltransferase [Treponema sp.]